MFYKLLNYLKSSETPEKHKRQYRLISYISWEAIIVAIIFIYLYAQSKLWVLIFMICGMVSLLAINLWILSRTKNTQLCSHLLTLIVFLVIITNNYLMCGIGPLYSQWFYVMPLIAASLTGMSGLLIYSIASMLLLIVYGLFAVPSYYAFSASQFLIIESLNHLFAYLVIVTTLANLILENQRYEQELHDKNYLLEAEKDKYHYLARFDHLTNLPNRRYFIQRLHETINAADLSHCITVFFIDLDNFKYVNDHYGHNIGDQVLLETSKRLKHCFREKDFIARLGGDEFTAIVEHAPNKNIPHTIAQRIIQEFKQAFQFANGIEYYCYISIGSATYPSDAQTAPDLIVKADLAMYAAKKINGNSYCETSKS